MDKKRIQRIIKINLVLLAVAIINYTMCRSILYAILMTIAGVGAGFYIVMQYVEEMAERMINNTINKIMDFEDGREN